MVRNIISNARLQDPRLSHTRGKEINNQLLIRKSVKEFVSMFYLLFLLFIWLYRVLAVAHGILVATYEI